jgi:hypothetical protein
MIEYVIADVTQGIYFSKIIFIVRQDECQKFHLDDTLNLLSPIKPQIIQLQSDTGGALCSVLLAIEHINNDESLMLIRSLMMGLLAMSMSSASKI